MANAAQSRATTVILWLLSIAAIGLIVFAVRSFTREQVEVTVVPVTYETLSLTVATNGKVEPVEEFPVHAPFAGEVKEILVHVGQPVSKGALLVRMDDADAQSRLAAAKAGLTNDLLLQRDLQNGGSSEELHRFDNDIASAKIEQQNATKELATRQKLLQQGAASPSEVAAAKQRLDNANLILQNAEKHQQTRFNSGDIQNAQTRTLDAQANVSAAQNAISHIDVRSPINGTVFNIPVSQYDWVQFGEDILDVADLKHLQVRAYFDEPDIGKLAANQPVTIVWAAKRGETWHGHVSLAPTTIFTYGTRFVGVCLISIDDPTPDLIPNTNVNVTVTEMERPHVLSIPHEALHIDGTRNFVYRIVNGKLAQTPVKIGLLNLTNVEILQGLKAGDLVVLGAKSSVTELTDGLQVKQAAE